MTWKRNTLKRLKINIHYDDNPDELKRIKHTSIKGVLIEKTI